MNLHDIDPAVLGVRLITLADIDPEAAHVAAVRAAVDVIDLRRQHRRDQIAISHDLAGATDWRVGVDEPTADELDRRRYPHESQRAIRAAARAESHPGLRPMCEHAPAGTCDRCGDLWSEGRDLMGWAA